MAAIRRRDRYGNHGNSMGLIYSNESKTRHWDGALQARLKRAPLEEFLQAHSLQIAHGAGRDSDNLARATVYLVEGGLTAFFQGRAEGLAESQHRAIGRLACLTTRAVARLIGEPASWRIPALLSTAQLLRPWIGLLAAACASADFIRQFSVALQDAPAPEDTRMSAAVSIAVQHNDNRSIRAVAEMIATCLSTATATCHPEHSHNPARPPRSLSG
jgi:hypothetical protein